MKTNLVAVVMAACATILPNTALAQQPARQGSGLQVQTMDSGFVIAPDAKFTKVNDNFFIAEPQVNAIWNVTPWMRLDAGVGYRLIGASALLEDQLRGVSGSIGLQFGGR